MVEMFIDPGLTTGWACFTDGKYLGESGVLDGRAVIKHEGNTLVVPRYIINAFLLVLKEHSPDTVYIEGVDMRGGHGNYASIMRGDLTRLAYMVGALQMQATLRSTAYIVSPLWKGNLSKDAMKAQLFLLASPLRMAKIRNHEIDAVAMGVFKYKNRWIKNWRMG